VKRIQMDHDEFLSKTKCTIAEIKTRKRVLLLALYVKGHGEGQ
jgi:hypothetical protein